MPNDRQKLRDDAGMLTALTWAVMSVCCYYKVGCAIVTADNHLIGQGYNGPPKGRPHCSEAGCAKSRKGSCEGLHAEDNAIHHASKIADLRGATIYITLQPCVKCSCRIVEAGIHRVVAASRYLRLPSPGDNRPDDIDQALGILADGGILFEWYKPHSEAAGELVAAHKRNIELAIASCTRSLAAG